MGASSSAFDQGSRGGQLAIITGAAAGIGLGAAWKCAWLGMDVVLTDVEEVALVAAVDSLQEQMQQSLDQVRSAMPVPLHSGLFDQSTGS